MRASTTDRARSTRLTVASFGGAATSAELAGAGIGRSRVRSALAAGKLVAMGHGVIACPDAPRDVVLARRLRAQPACLTALRAHGVGVLVEPARPHVLVASRRLPTRAVVLHRGRAVPRGRAEPVTLADAVEQVIRCRPAVEALVVVDAVLRDHLVDLGDLRERFPDGGRRAGRWVLDHADPRAESVLESALRCRMLQGGITDIRSQVWVRDVGRVDFVVDGWLVVEADGFAHHSSPADQVRDADRTAAALGHGMPTLRFPYSSVVTSPDAVLAAIAAARARFASQTGHFRTRVGEAGSVDQGGRERTL